MSGYAPKGHKHIAQDRSAMGLQAFSPLCFIYSFNGRTINKKTKVFLDLFISVKQCECQLKAMRKSCYTSI